jgi:hypothetical protein
MRQCAVPVRAVVCAGLFAGLALTGCTSTSTTSEPASSSVGAAARSARSDSAPGVVPSSPSSSTSANPPAPPTSRASAQTASARPAPLSTPARDPDLVPDQTSVLASLPGNASSACVKVGATTTDTRAGGIGVGNFTAARAAYKRSAASASAAVPTVFLYVIPQHAAHLHGLKVSIRASSGAEPTRTLTSTSVEQAEAQRYFAVNLPITAPGTYRLTMVSGSDKGCFDVSFAR